MNKNSKNSTLSILIPILLALFLAKAFWVGVSYLYLPKSGVDKEADTKVEPLYYRYSLASKKDAPKPIVQPKKVKKRAPKPKPRNLAVKKFVLKGIYAARDQKIATIEYQGKTYVLEVGEEIKGFKLVQVKPTYVLFRKDKEDYKLEIFKNQQNELSSEVFTSPSMSTPRKKEKAKEKKEEIIHEGDTTIISKNLFNKYKSNLGSLRKYIGGVPVLKNGKLTGFKISYIKAGSDFDKVGLKRGDIITAINGEEITDLSVPMRFMNNINSITAATITVKRGNEVKELEYEVR